MKQFASGIMFFTSKARPFPGKIHFSKEICCKSYLTDNAPHTENQ